MEGASIDQLRERVDDRMSERSSVNEGKECEREYLEVKKKVGLLDCVPMEG